MPEADKKSITYSVIAVINSSDKALDIFIQAFTSQTLGFIEHIQLILIGNGINTEQADAIEKWRARYPENIYFLEIEKSENILARNSGLNYAKGKWVQFIEPKDFFDRPYFENVDKFIKDNYKNDLGLFVTNVVYCLNKKHLYEEAYYLKGYFDRGIKVFSVKELDEAIRLNLNGVLFRLDLLLGLMQNNCCESSLQPEDFYLLYTLLIIHPEIKIGIIQNARFYYRKRQEHKSNIKNIKPDRYNAEAEQRWLLLLKTAEDRLGYIPGWLQKTLFCDLSYRVKTLLNHSEYTLPEPDKSQYFSLIHEIMALLDDEVVEDFNAPEINGSIKAGLKGLFKHKVGLYAGVNILKIDQKRKLVKLNYYYYGNNPRESFYINNIKITPAFGKYINNDLLGNHFSAERIVWLPYYSFNLKAKLAVEIDDNKVNLHSGEKLKSKAFSLADIVASLESGSSRGRGLPSRSQLRSYLKPRIRLYLLAYVTGARFGKIIDDNKRFIYLFLDILVTEFFYRYNQCLRYTANTFLVKKLFQNAWLLIDRDTQADDNAEHLYRYIQNNHQSINAFFVIRKKSHDSSRLKKEGFRLIWFGSLKHKLALLNARHIATSHITDYATDYLNKKYYQANIDYDVTFLQHGVTVHDTSARINHKKIALIITTGEREYHSIVDDNTNYKFTEKEVALTGFPRHDSLLVNGEQERIVLIMPTWRRSLVGGSVRDPYSSEKSFKDIFLESSYYFRWKNLLHSPVLKNLITKYDYKVIFYPHAYMKPYLEYFAAPDYIEIRHHSAEQSIQELFGKAGCMITDYSSVAFEMAYLYKPVLYYQFDHDQFFGILHPFSKGYFDYLEDGFGPVCFEEANLLEELEKLFKRSCQPENIYYKKMNDFFAYRDGKCCERVMKEILSLDEEISTVIDGNIEPESKTSK